jgi:cytidylate kinase
MEGRKGFVVAIDGPAGAGKSTVSRQLAEALGGRLLDTGAMYRGVAYLSLKEGADAEEEVSLIARKVHFRADKSGQSLLINGEELGVRLRTQKVSDKASSVSRFREVRRLLTQRQRTLARQWARRMPVVVEGRDIGTVVFPNVPFKFYVTADPEVRAARRLAQLKRQGVKGASLKKILKENEERDRQDSTRKLAPLKCPEDAVIVDTSSMAVPQVVQFMRDHIKAYITLPNIKKT